MCKYKQIHAKHIHSAYRNKMTVIDKSSFFATILYYQILLERCKMPGIFKLNFSKKRYGKFKNSR